MRVSEGDQVLVVDRLVDEVDVTEYVAERDIDEVVERLRDCVIEAVHVVEGDRVNDTLLVPLLECVMVWEYVPTANRNFTTAPGFALTPK